jgi:hypothetical protein
MQFLEINLEEMQKILDRLYKTANFCLRELDLGEVSLHFK